MVEILILFLQILRNLNHRNVVQYYTSFVSETRLWIVTEYMNCKYIICIYYTYTPLLLLCENSIPHIF